MPNPEISKKERKKGSKKERKKERKLFYSNSKSYIGSYIGLYKDHKKLINNKVPLNIYFYKFLHLFESYNVMYIFALDQC